MTHWIRFGKVLCVLFLLLGLWACCNTAQAVSLIWDSAITGGPNGGTGTWDTNATNNWWDITSSADVVWPALGGTDDDAVFGSTAGIVSIAPGGVTANDLTFNTDGYLIQNNTLTLNGATPTITVATGMGATISSAIAGDSALTKAGTGTLILSGSNDSLSGGVNLAAGTLVLGSAAALGTGTLAISDGVKLDSSVADLVNNKNNVQTWNGSFTFLGTQNLNLGTGAVTMSGNTTINVSAKTLTVGGNITTPLGGTLEKTGPGVLNLTGQLFSDADDSSKLRHVGIKEGTLKLANTNVYCTRFFTGYGGVNTNVTATNTAITVDGNVDWGDLSIGYNANATACYDMRGGSLTIIYGSISMSPSGGGVKSIMTLDNNASVDLNTGSAIWMGDNGAQNGSTTVVMRNGSVTLSTDSYLQVGVVGGRNVFDQIGGAVNSPGALRLQYRMNKSDNFGIYNLGNAATLTAGAIVSGDGTSNFTKNNAYLNFHGGTLSPAGISTNFVRTTLSGSSAALAAPQLLVYSEGAVIDNTFNITINEPLVAPAGQGVSSGTITIPLANQGSGYKATPIINVVRDGTDTTGVTATAIANMVDDGTNNGTFKIGSITITNPGINYMATPTLTASGGDPATVAVLPALSIATNISGGLTKKGLGTLTLNGNNTYAGNTVIKAGMLVLGANGSIANSKTIIVGDIGSNGASLDVTPKADGLTIAPGQTLAGIGVVTGGPVTIGSGATIAPGDRTATVPTRGTLTIANAVNLTGGTTDIRIFNLDSNDKLNGLSQFTYGGILKINNINSTAFAVGNQWDLFDFASHTGQFSNNAVFGTEGDGEFLPKLTNLKWQFDYAQGVLSVVPGGVSAPTIGPIMATPAHATIITGGGTAFGFTVQNTGTAALNFSTTAGANTSGTVGGPTTVAAGSNSNSISGLSFNGTTVGPAQTGTFDVADGAATNSPQTGTVTVNVLDHASGSVIGTLDLGNIHEGYTNSITSNDVSVTNAQGYRADLAGSAAGAIGNISLSSVRGIAAGGSKNINATLATGRAAGPIDETFTYTFSDDSGLSGASSNVGTANLTVTGQVYSGKGVWGTETAGSWSNFNNWTTGGAPGVTDGFKTGIDTATFSNNIIATVDLSIDSPAISAINFHAGSYTIRPSGNGETLILDNTVASGEATINSAAGIHSITAPVQLNSNLTATISSGSTLTLSGQISGSGKGITKEGAGTLVIAPEYVTNDYSGQTVLKAGTLQLGGTDSVGFATGSGAWAPVLSPGAAGADIQGGKMVFDYSGEGGSSPAGDIGTLLTASHDAGWTGAGVQIKSTTAAGNANLVLGWKDDLASQVTVMLTYAGDWDLNGSVNLDDLNIWKANFGIGSGAIFAQGDFDYNGAVNLDDLNAWKATFGLAPLTTVAGPSNIPLSQPVPEPSTMALLVAGLAGLLGYTWRKRRS